MRIFGGADEETVRWVYIDSGSLHLYESAEPGQGPHYELVPFDVEDSEHFDGGWLEVAWELKELYPKCDCCSEKLPQHVCPPRLVSTFLGDHDGDYTVCFTLVDGRRFLLDESVLIGVRWEEKYGELWEIRRMSGPAKPKSEGLEGCGPNCALCVQSFHCYREEYGEVAYQQAWAATLAEWDQEKGDQSEGLVQDAGEREGNFRRFTVPMELQVTAASKAEALELAMQWRDAVAGAMAPGTAPELPGVDFDWHLHHPWGC
jgi:hypothetical protein